MATTIQDNVLLAAGNIVVGGPVPSGLQRIYTAVSVRNPTGASITLTLHLVPDGAAASATNTIFSRPVLAGKTDVCLQVIGRGLNANGTLVINAPACTVGYTAIDTIVAE